MRNAVLLVLVAATSLLGGCDATPTDYMPMEVGMKRTYVVRSAFIGMVEPIEISRETSVAGTQGVEVRGPMGISKLAWRNRRLVADQLTHTRFAPPLSLLAPTEVDMGIEFEKRPPIPWKGNVLLLNKSYPAKAELRQDEAQEELFGRPMPGMKSILRIEIPELKRTISVESTFVRGIGLVRQVQRTDGRQDFDLRLLYDAK